MARKPQLVDQWGRPVKRAELTREVSAPTLGGVRSPILGDPASGLDPVRLAGILRAADAGDPVQYLELAEIIEERDLHYVGVLGTRRRSVSQLDISVEPGGETPRDLEIAREIEGWLTRDELAGELFHILDAVGKGYSFTEIIWDTSMGQWQPARLEYRDPRWFRFARHDLATPLKLDEHGAEQPLEAFKYIFARMQAKSGIALRSGLARSVFWAYLFKKYTERDWAIFTQTYGQPVRVGKFGAGASEKDKDTLMRAVANIAGDMAAIIPESMTLDFVETGNLGTGHTNYKERAEFYDQQVSKAVLGQTATTDAVTGGLGSGKEHRQVQEDIERADAKDLSAIVNAYLVRPWVQLNHGPQPAYPRIRIARAEAEDLSALSSALTPLIAAGLRVSAKEVRDRFSLSTPEAGDEIIGISPQTPPSGDPGGEGLARNPSVKRSDGPIKRHKPDPATTGADGVEMQAEAASDEIDPVTAIADRLEVEARPAVGGMIETIESMLRSAGSLEEFREMLLAGFDDLDASALEAVLAEGFAAAHAAGRVAAEEEGG